MLWHIELKFYIWLCLTVLQIKFECRQFASIFVGVMPLSGLTGNTQLYTCIDKFTWNLKFHVGFFNVFLLCFRKVLYKNSPLKCSWRAYYAPFAVLRYILSLLQSHFYTCPLWPWPWLISSKISRVHPLIFATCFCKLLYFCKYQFLSNFEKGPFRQYVNSSFQDYQNLIFFPGTLPKNIFFLCTW